MLSAKFQEGGQGHMEWKTKPLQKEWQSLTLHKGTEIESAV